MGGRSCDWLVTVWFVVRLTVTSCGGITLLVERSCLSKVEGGLGVANDGGRPSIADGGARPFIMLLHMFTLIHTKGR